MFAGLPGIGVGTLFYVLMALWMPIRELPRALKGTSSLATWRLIAQQLCYAAGIVVTVMFAENVLLWILVDESRINPMSPATWCMPNWARAKTARSSARRSPRRC